MGPPWAYAFPAALAIALVATPLLRRLALATGIVDRPGERKSHHTPVPYLGGVGIMVGVLGAALFIPSLGLRGSALIVAGLVLGAVGLLDDDHSVPPEIRFLAEALAASLAVAAGLRIHATGIEVFDIALTVMWIVGITNALNLLDNMDGLSAGVAGTAAVAVFFLAIFNGQVVAATLSAGLAGACAGFLVFNRRPASIFMGDAGSLFLGFALAVLTIDVNPGLAPPASFTVPVILLGLAVLDTTTVSLARARRGRSVWLGGKDHLSHRLVALGLSPGPAVCILVCTQSLLGAIAVLAGRRVVAVVPACLAAVAILGALAIVTSRADVYPEPVRRLSTRMRLGLVGAGGIACLLVLPAIVAMVQADGQVRQGAAFATRAAAADDPGRARADLQQASALFRRAKGRLDGRLASLGLFVPGLASNLRAARTLASVGSDLAGSATKVAAVADAGQLRVSDSSGDADGLARLVPVLDEAAGTLAGAQARLAAADRPYVLARFRYPLEDLRSAVKTGADAASLMADTARSLPGLLGKGGARNYLLASANGSEGGSGGGGPLVAWGELRAEDGRLSLVPGRNDLPTTVPGAGDPSQPTGHPDGVSSPDFPTAARALISLDSGPQSGEDKINGVIGVDTTGLAALAHLIGPFSVEGFPELVTSDNLKSLLSRVSGDEAPGGNGLSGPLGRVSAALWRAALIADLGNGQRVVGELAGAARGGHLTAFLVDRDEQALMSRIGASGEVPEVRGDSVIVAGQTRSDDEGNRRLLGQVTYDVHLDPAPGSAHLTSQLVVNLRNDGERGNGQGGKGSLSGDHRTDVSVFSPFPVTSASVDGRAVEVRRSEDLGRRVGSAELEVPPTETRTLRFDLAGDIKLGENGWYRLDALPQSVSASEGGQITVSVPKGWIITDTRGVFAQGSRLATGPLPSERAGSVWVRVQRSATGRLWDSLMGRD